MKVVIRVPHGNRVYARWYRLNSSVKYINYDKPKNKVTIHYTNDTHQVICDGEHCGSVYNSIIDKMKATNIMRESYEESGDDYPNRSI
jgi:hypothetical protein